MEIGIDSFAATTANVSGVTISASDRLRDLVEEIERADQVGLDHFGIGEHHRIEFLDSAPVVILAAAASRTKKIRLTSAVTVLSAADPVRVFQEFATLDLISQGRAEIVAGRGSFTEAYPLFGLDLNDYDSLFAEKLDLLLKLRADTHVRWSGKHRPSLHGEAVYPRPFQKPLPVWVGVGGTPASFVRAGLLGLPLMVAIIGGDPRSFQPLIDLYRETGLKAGHSSEKLKVGLHCIGFLGETTQQQSGLELPVTTTGRPAGETVGSGVVVGQLGGRRVRSESGNSAACTSGWYNSQRTSHFRLSNSARGRLPVCRLTRRSLPSTGCRSLIQ
jgi:probable LLM family oxidoreductase